MMLSLRLLINLFLQVLQQGEARELGGRVLGGIAQRLAARFLQQVLQAPTSTSSIQV